MWHPRIRYSGAETNNAVFVRVIDSEQLWERMSLLLLEIRQARAVTTHSQNQNLFTITDITVTHRCVTRLLPLCRHCPSSGSSCPAGGQGCPRVLCARSGRGSGDHSPGSCSPSPPSPSSPRQSSPRWAPQTSSSRALRSGVRWAQWWPSTWAQSTLPDVCLRHRLLSTFYQNVKMISPFENDSKLCPISPKLPWMLLNTLLILVTGPRMSPRCLLIIGVSLLVTKPHWGKGPDCPIAILAL